MKFPPSADTKMPDNYKLLRRLEWTQIKLKGIVSGPDREVWDWMGQSLSHSWSYRNNIADGRTYYFEDEKDAIMFSLRWL